MATNATQKNWIQIKDTYDNTFDTSVLAETNNQTSSNSGTRCARNVSEFHVLCANDMKKKSERIVRLTNQNERGKDFSALIGQTNLSSNSSTFGYLNISSVRITFGAYIGNECDVYLESKHVNLLT